MQRIKDIALDLHIRGQKEFKWQKELERQITSMSKFELIVHIDSKD